MIVFDFDGVILDSLNEITVTAYNIVSNSLHTTLPDINSNFVRLFKRNRFNVEDPSDLIVLAEWCLANTGNDPDIILTFEEYDNLVKQKIDSREERRKRWFEARSKFASVDLEAWLKLNRPFEPLWSNLQKLDPEKLFIITDKTLHAILDITSHYGINLNSKKVFSGETGTPRSERLKAVQTATKNEHIFYVDDSIKHLLEISQNFTATEVTLLLASWGYIGPNDLQKAQERGFRVVTQEDIIALLS